jgi:hypothetical protein
VQQGNPFWSYVGAALGGLTIGRIVSLRGLSSLYTLEGEVNLSTISELIARSFFYYLFAKSNHDVPWYDTDDDVLPMVHTKDDITTFPS